MKLIPLENHVIVEPLEAEQTTASGIILSQKDNEKPTTGKVVAVGPGLLNDDGTRAPMDVAVSDIIHFTAYAPDEITVDDETYLVIKSTSILAKQA
jgi:chaperonin GroES